jgi:hypothetical protein
MFGVFQQHPPNRNGVVFAFIMFGGFGDTPVATREYRQKHYSSSLEVMTRKFVMHWTLSRSIRFVYGLGRGYANIHTDTYPHMICPRQPNLHHHHHLLLTCDDVSSNSHLHKKESWVLPIYSAKSGVLQSTCRVPTLKRQYITATSDLITATDNSILIDNKRTE